MIRSLCSQSVKLSKDLTVLRLWRNIKQSFPRCFTIHLPSKLQMALFTASITFNLVILLLISELKMETLHHYPPLKKRLIVFCWDEERCVTAVTQKKASETVGERAEMNVRVISGVIYWRIRGVWGNIARQWRSMWQPVFDFFFFFLFGLSWIGGDERLHKGI